MLLRRAVPRLVHVLPYVARHLEHMGTSWKSDRKQLL